MNHQPKPPKEDTLPPAAPVAPTPTADQYVAKPARYLHFSESGDRGPWGQYEGSGGDWMLRA